MCYMTNCIESDHEDLCTYMYLNYDNKNIMYKVMIKYMCSNHSNNYCDQFPAIVVKVQ